MTTRDLTPKNALDTSTSPIDKSCNYTATFSQTSSAAPTVSGAAALLLQVNPSLTWRDVKYVLATTARTPKPGFLDQPASSYNGQVLDPGWVTNAAGHPFSNWYGFGLIDTTSAVNAARNFKTLPALLDTDWQTSASNLNAASGSNASMTISNVISKIETVQIGLTSSYKTPANLLITLTSPSGTKSVIMTPFSALKPVTGGFDIDLMASNAFLDENANGEWKLQVTDLKDGTSGGQLNNWKIHILGH